MWVLLKPKYYCRFVDDTYRRRKKNEPDELFSKMNSFHPNINLTLEINLSKFLDTKIVRKKNEINCFPHHKDNKLSSHWKSVVPRNYKKNFIVGELHRVGKRNFCNQNKVFKSRLSQWIYWFHNKWFSSNQRFSHSNIIIWRAERN